MKFIALRPMLWTSNLAATVSFYADILGFACGNRDDESGWASLLKDEVEIMIAVPNKQIPFNGPVFTGSLYINTDNIEKLWDSVKGKVKIAFALNTFEYGMKEFAIYDNNGYLLQFGQEVLA